MLAEYVKLYPRAGAVELAPSRQLLRVNVGVREQGLGFVILVQRAVSGNSSCRAVIRQGLRGCLVFPESDKQVASRVVQQPVCPNEVEAQDSLMIAVAQHEERPQHVEGTDGDVGYPAHFADHLFGISVEDAEAPGDVERHAAEVLFSQLVLS